MSKYISQYDEVVSSDSTDYYLLQRGTAYKKFTKANFFNQIANELGIGQSTLVGLTDVDTTYLSNGDTISYNSATETFEFVALVGSVALDDITDVTITGLATNDVLAWNGSAYVNNATYARVSGVTTGFIPVSTGSNTFTNGTLTDNGTNIGFNTATYTYSFSFGGNTARTFGVNRHTTADTAGVSFSHYAGGATSGATNKNGGNYDIYSGISTGTGTSQFNVYTSPAGSTGTTDNTQTLKLNIDGSGTAYFTTSTANSKWKAGHNLATILTQTTGIGIEMARPSDGSYTVHGGMFASATSDTLTFSGFGSGFRFVRNPSTDTVAGVTIGSGYNASIISGVSSSTYRYQFYRTYVDTENQSLFSCTNASGTNADAAKKPTAIEAVTSVTNSVSYNVGIGIAVSGSTYLSSTGNLAMYIIDSSHIYSVGGGLYLGNAPSTTIKFQCIGASTHTQMASFNQENISSGNSTIVTIQSSAAAASTNKYGLYMNITGGAINTAVYIERGNFVTLLETRVGIGTATPNASSRLEISSTVGGFLTARMTATQASAITGVNGLSLYVTDTNGTFTSVGFWGYENGAWVKL